MGMGTGLNRRQGLVLGAAGLSALALPGCVSMPPASAEAGAAADPAQGQVLLRVATSGLVNVNSFVVQARRRGGGPLIALRGWGPGSDGYWGSYYQDNEKGQLVQLALPPGDYELVSFGLMTGAWGGLRAIEPQQPFSLPFSVAAGEVVYLGALLVRFAPTGTGTGPLKGLVQIDARRNIAYEVLVQDARARDFAELPQRAPGLAPDRVVVRLLR